ncbi:MAG: hypothetical protein ACYCOR_13735 [Acidobacteriaceae bacterium]
MLCRVFGLAWQAWTKTYKTRRQFTPHTGGGYHSVRFLRAHWIELLFAVICCAYLVALAMMLMDAA